MRPLTVGAAKQLVRPGLSSWPKWDPATDDCTRWNQISQPRAPRRISRPEQFSEAWLTPSVWRVPDHMYWQTDLWSADNLKRRSGEELVSLGTRDDDGSEVLCQLDEYLDYAQNQSDRNPLYLFDPDISWLGLQFVVPEPFSDDTLALLDEDVRPDFQWLLLGPTRSGTLWHIDPIGSAWNNVMHGSKRWVLTAPGVELPAAADNDLVGWFASDWPSARCQLPSTEVWFDFVQQPGELVYVPHGWGHAVINLEPSVALTLNFVVERDLRECFQRTKADYPELAQEWEKAIGRLRPELSVHLT